MIIKTQDNEYLNAGSSTWLITIETSGPNTQLVHSDFESGIDTEITRLAAPEITAKIEEQYVKAVQANLLYWDANI